MMKNLIYVQFILITLFVFNAVKAEAATSIYRSASPSATTALSTTTASNITLSISGSTATFSGAQPTNIGVGDAIQYDSDNNGTIDSIAFIHGRTSATVYTVKNALGGTATSTSASDTDWSIFRAYTSAANAEKGVENTGIETTLRNFDDWTVGGTAATDDVGKDLITADQQWNIALYANGTTSDTTIVTIDGWATATDNYIKLYTPNLISEVGITQRHAGVWDDTKYNLNPSVGTWILSINDNHVWVDGLQIIARTGGVSAGIGYYSTAAGSNLFQISNNIIKGSFTDSSSAGYGITGSGSDSIAKIWNNIIYDFRNTSGTGAFFAFRGYGINTMYNNTAYNSSICYKRETGTLISKNNIAQACVNYGYYNMSASSSNNISNLNDAPGANSKSSSTVSFIDAANRNLHIQSSDTVAKDAGVNLSTDPNGLLSFTTDIDGETRTGTWDIGADEDYTPDTTPPVRSVGSPSGSQSNGTTQVTLQLATNEISVCKYSTISNTSYASMSDTFTDTSSTTHSQLITGLTPGSSYGYYVRCIDENSNPNMDDYTISFSVSAEGIPAVSNLGPTKLTDGSWTNDNTPTLTFTTSDSNSNLQYEIQIATSSDYTQIVDSYISGSVAPGNSTYTAATLPEGTYYWRVRVFDGTSTSTWSNANVGVAFGIDTTAPIPGTISFTNTATTSITISQTSSDSGSGLATLPYVYHATSIGYDVSSVATVATSSTFSNLNTSTEYFFSVIVQDKAGNVATSSVSSATTGATNPLSISSIASSTTNTTATITWITNELATSTINYGLDTDYGIASSSVTSKTSHSFKLTGLATSTTYHFRISSWDSLGNLVTSSDYTFTTKNSTYVYPIGIPEAWIDPNTPAPARPDVWTSEIPGYYYVDWTTGTDSGRTYGHPGAPRKTIPNPIPAGSRVEVNGAYGQTSWVNFSAQGTAGDWVANTSGPAWVVGNDVSPAVFVGWPWLRGEYLCVDNIATNGSGMQFATVNNTSGYKAKYMLFRNSEIVGTTGIINTAVEIAHNTNVAGGTNDIVFYNNIVHGFGPVTPPVWYDGITGYDLDAMGIFVDNGASNIWVLENEIYDMSGGGIAVSSATNGSGLMVDGAYIGKNNVYNTWAAGIGVKSSRNVVVSQNTVHDIKYTFWSEGKGIGAQYALESLWIIGNHVYNGNLGIKVGGGAGPNNMNVYVIGNLLHDILEYPIETNPYPAALNGYHGAITIWSGNTKAVIGNTLYNVHNGIVFPGTASDLGPNGFIVENNIVANVEKYHLEIDTGASYSTWRNNLLYQDDGPVLVQISGEKNVATANALAYVDGLIEGNPLFNNIANDDYSISTSSPARDAGLAPSNLVLNVYNEYFNDFGIDIAKDLTGADRPQGGIWDIGAYEYDSGNPPPTTYTLTISKTGQGTFSASYSSTTGTFSTSKSFNEGTVVTLTAVPTTGYAFAGWSNGCTGTSTCVVTMDQARSVYATFTANPVNGSCGSSNGTTLDTIPTTNLCLTGTPTTVLWSGPWTWTCEGANSGTIDTSCTAAKTAVAINGSCGTPNGTTVSTAPTANLCTTGTASDVTWSGPWNWTCMGINGGNQSGTCSASKTTSGGGGGGGGGTVGTSPAIIKKPTTEFPKLDSAPTISKGQKSFDEFLTKTLSERKRIWFATRLETVLLSLTVKGIPILRDYTCKKQHTDTFGTNVPSYTCQVAEKAQAAKIISQTNKQFNPMKPVSRIEAYAIMMKSICVMPETTNTNWQKEVIQKAHELWFTVRTLDTFEPDRPLSIPEMYTVVQRLSEYRKGHETCKV